MNIAAIFSVIEMGLVSQITLGYDGKRIERSRPGPTWFDPLRD